MRREEIVLEGRECSEIMGNNIRGGKKAGGNEGKMSEGEKRSRLGLSGRPSKCSLISTEGG